MSTVVFALHQQLDISSSEGDEDQREIHVVTLKFISDRNIERRATDIAVIMSEKLHCYAQVWDIC